MNFLIIETQKKESCLWQKFPQRSMGALLCNLVSGCLANITTTEQIGRWDCQLSHVIATSSWFFFVACCRIGCEHAHDTKLDHLGSLTVCCHIVVRITSQGKVRVAVNERNDLRGHPLSLVVGSAFMGFLSVALCKKWPIVTDIISLR